MLMASARLRRTSLFLDSVALARARRALNARTDAEAVRLSIERVTEMERFWRFMERTRRSVPAGSFERAGMRWAIVATSVYIGHWERGASTSALETVRQAYVVRHSAVVLSELRRGARTAAAQRLVES